MTALDTLRVTNAYLNVPVSQFPEIATARRAVHATPANEPDEFIENSAHLLHRVGALAILATGGFND